MIGRLYGLGRRAARHRAEELLERLGLLDAADRMVRTYSGGMRRRLDIAASLVAAPPILFLDEPTTGLDPRGRIELWQLLEELTADGASLLLTTQYLEEADRLADRIVVVDRGRVVAAGNVRPSSRPRSAATASSCTRSRGPTPGGSPRRWPDSARGRPRSMRPRVASCCSSTTGRPSSRSWPRAWPPPALESPSWRCASRPSTTCS